MLVAYSYLRFSRLEQRRGDSFRRQTALRDAYVKQKGATLDMSLVLEDKGKSAFRGKHRTTGRLRYFLEAVKNGHIPKGSLFIVENLDRLSREQVEEAFTLFMDIVRAGITIVTLLPSVVEYTAGTMGFAHYIFALSEFVRGHGESLTKSKRGKEIWQEERSKGAEGRLIHNLPTWIERVDDKFRLREDKAEVVRQVFRWALDGLGGLLISRRLNERNVAPFGPGKRWHKSYVAVLLRSRSAMGEHQPHTIDDDGKRVPIGKPIPNYFPHAVTPELFAQVQLATQKRHHKRSGINHHTTNLFAGLVRDESGDSYSVQNRNTHPYLVSIALVDGKPNRLSSIPYRPFERTVLTWIKEIDLDPVRDDPLPGLKARETLLVADLDELERSMKRSSGLAKLIGVFENKQTELAKVRQQIQESMTPRQHVLADAKLAIEYLSAAKPDDMEDVRRRLRHYLSLLLSEIVVRVDGMFRSRRKVYYITLKFTSGEVRQVFFETGTKGEYATGPWSEDWPDDETMNLRDEVIRRTQEQKGKNPKR